MKTYKFSNYWVLYFNIKFYNIVYDESCILYKLYIQHKNTDDGREILPSNHFIGLSCIAPYPQTLFDELE